MFQRTAFHFQRLDNYSHKENDSILNQVFNAFQYNFIRLTKYDVHVYQVFLNYIQMKL
jgi:hypothetical protein